MTRNLTAVGKDVMTLGTLPVTLLALLVLGVLAAVWVKAKRRRARSAAPVRGTWSPTPEPRPFSPEAWSRRGVAA